MTQQDTHSRFDAHAATYDTQWAKLSPLLNAMHLLIGALFSELRDDARILVVGAGTGAELLYLAKRFPRWRFTAVEPSAPMLDILRHRIDDDGILTRCELHNGYLDSLPDSEPFDAATSLLVSQFILDRTARRAFFRGIGARLEPNGLLASADLAADMESSAFEGLLEIWLRIMTAADAPADALERMRASYGRDVALLPPDDVAAIIASGGFDTPIRFFQAGLIHAWYSRRTSRVVG